MCGGIKGCDHCRGLDQCPDPPTADEPIQGPDDMVIDCCPLLVIPQRLWQLMPLYRLYEKGLPPLAGGVLDQAANFILAFDFYLGEKNYWKNKLGLL